MRYRTIVADPPWPIAWSTPATRVNGRGERHVNHKRELGYPTMSLDQIASLPVDGLADKKHGYLLLWVTETLLLGGLAREIAGAWGFVERRTLIWKKTGFGLGTFPRPQHETCVLCSRPGLALPSEPKDIGSVQTWKLVYENGARKHSAKPDGFYDLVFNVFPGPYLEMFARRNRLGWDTWGDEALEHVQVESA